MNKTKAQLTLEKYGPYGFPVGHIPDNIEKGDTVMFLLAKSGAYGKRVFVELIGIWDGEKVEFADKTVVRNIYWLKKIN